MRQAILFSLIVCVLTGCEEASNPAAHLENPLIEDGSKDICLLPYLGFTSIGHEQREIQIDYYCDVVNPPQKKVISNATENDFYSGSRIPLEKRLEPATTYYWRYVAKDIGYDDFQSEIYSFTTIDMGLLNKDIVVNQRFLIDSVNFFMTTKGWFSDFELDEKEMELTGDIVSFLKTGDTIQSANYYGDPLRKIFPIHGDYQFGTDSVQIIENVYDFIDFGKERESSNEILLALKRKRDDVILVYDCNEYLP